MNMWQVSFPWSSGLLAARKSKKATLKRHQTDIQMLIADLRRLDSFSVLMFFLWGYNYKLICAILLLYHQGSYIDVANTLGYKEFVKLIDVSKSIRDIVRNITCVLCNIEIANKSLITLLRSWCCQFLLTYILHCTASRIEKQPGYSSKQTCADVLANWWRHTRSATWPNDAADGSFTCWGLDTIYTIPCCNTNSGQCFSWLLP